MRLINWGAPLHDIYNLVGGVTAPFPGAFTFLDGKKVHLWRVGMVEAPIDVAPGTVLGPYFTHGSSPLVGLAVATRGGLLICQNVEIEGQGCLEGDALYRVAETWRGKRFESGVEPATRQYQDIGPREGLDPVARKVLDVYQRVNPSTYPFEDNEFYQRYSEICRRLFLDYLKLPPAVFRNARILEFGSGTGEHSLFLALAGGRLTCVEMNPEAVLRFKYLMQRFGVWDRVEDLQCQSLFDWTCPPGTEYDLVIANGMLPHTRDPRQGFAHLVRPLKRGGFAVVGGACSSGCFQRNLQRYILFSLAEGEEEIVRLARCLFREHLERSVRIGGRSEEAIIYDTYINPKIHTFTAVEMLGWFEEEGLRFYSGWPPITPPGFGDSYKQAPIWLEEAPFRYMAVLSDLVWLVHSREDREVFLDASKESREIWEQLHEAVGPLADITPENYSVIRSDRIVRALDQLVENPQIFDPGSLMVSMRDQLIRFRDELAQVLRLVEARKVDELEEAIARTSVLFKGTAGLGMNFFVGYRA